MNDLRRYVLIDTNVLVNAVDPNEETRAKTAATVIRSLVDEERAAISTQVVVEFFESTTRRKARQLPIFTPSQAAVAVHDMLQTCECLGVSQTIVEDAVRAAQQYRMRVYDAQIWAVAKNARIRFVLTEDFQSQPEIEGVRYVNPFAPAFRLEHIGL